MPVIYTQDLPAFIDDIKQSSVTVYAAHLDGKKSYREVRYGSRIAFLIGNEGAGLSDEITKKADELVRIPMQGKLESLNAAVAAALLMYSL
jgi:TrmH family RNA methyltransferase